VVIQDTRIGQVIQDTRIGQQLIVERVLPLPQPTEMDDGIPQTADADLQGAAVANQGAGLQSEQIIGGIHRHVGGTEQPKVTTGMIEH